MVNIILHTFVFYSKKNINGNIIHYVPDCSNTMLETQQFDEQKKIVRKTAIKNKILHTYTHISINDSFDLHFLFP